MKVLSDTDQQKNLESLNQKTQDDWSLLNGKLRKEFQFNNFTSAFRFITLVSEEAEKLDHHPDWCNRYNKVMIELTTHSAGGLTELDFKLASTVEKISGEIS